MFKHPVGVLLGLCLAVPALVGCSRGPRTVAAEGVVTFKGQAVEGAMVMFSPATAGQGMPAFGTTDAEGKFTLRTQQGIASGLVPGEYVVTIVKTREVPTGEKIPNPEGGFDEMKRVEHLLPQKYSTASTSPLKVKVEAGNVKPFQFDLEE